MVVTLPLMKGRWTRVLEEPYRVFFPLGVLASVWGVLMWPMWYGKWLPFYPGEAHLRMMIEGFLGAFVLGFIGTAFPRLAGNRRWSGVELLVLLGLWALAVGCHAGGRVAAGDGVFSGMLVLLFAGMAGRWLLGNKDTPPPGFVLALVGILGGALAAGFLACSINPAPAAAQWARLWLSQGFLLLPLLGIGPYLLPRFFGMASSHALDDSPRPPAGW